MPVFFMVAEVCFENYGSKSSAETNLYNKAENPLIHFSLSPFLFFHFNQYSIEKAQPKFLVNPQHFAEIKITNINKKVKKLGSSWITEFIWSFQECSKVSWSFLKSFGFWNVHRPVWKQPIKSDDIFILWRIVESWQKRRFCSEIGRQTSCKWL